MNSNPFVELPGLRVTVDEVQYQPLAATPPDQPHCFAYFITIHNDSTLTVTIKARKWVVHQDHNELLVMEGDGVVGQFPQLEPGQTFSYNSFHLLKSQSGSARGSYIGQDELGRRILVSIPQFEMIVPD